MANTNQAVIMASKEAVSVVAPYNASFVAEVKMIPGRKWDGVYKAWLVPNAYEAQLREIARKYYELADESNAPEYEIIQVEVAGSNTSKRSYPNGVTIDGYNLINLTYGNIIHQPNPVFEVLEVEGGYVRGDSHHAFEVEYTVTLQVRKGAKFETTGRQLNGGSWFRIVKG